MSKKSSNRRSPKVLTGMWLASLLSLGLLYISGRAVLADFASFRSCSANSNGLYISSCGKQGINLGDLILLVLFVLCAALVVSLFTHSWRITRREQS